MFVQCFRYAVATGRAERDPAADLLGAFKTRPVKHHAAITDPQRVGELLRAIDGYQGDIVTRLAFRLAPLVFVRPGELRQAEWSELDMVAAEWRIPAEKMKVRQAHLVPLSRQALAIIEELQPHTGPGGYLFPSIRSRKRPMSENTLSGALRRLGYPKEEMSWHGFRGMASTLLHEQGWQSEVIELQLAHTDKNQIRAAYNRAELMPERQKMMQHWADYLDGLKAGGNIINLADRRAI